MGRGQIELRLPSKRNRAMATGSPFKIQKSEKISRRWQCYTLPMVKLQLKITNIHGYIKMTNSASKVERSAKFQTSSIWRNLSSLCSPKYKIFRIEILHVHKVHHCPMCQKKVHHCPHINFHNFWIFKILFSNFENKVIYKAQLHECTCTRAHIGIST
jgi:hypothetical protein